MLYDGEINWLRETTLMYNFRPLRGQEEVNPGPDSQNVHERILLTFHGNQLEHIKTKM